MNSLTEPLPGCRDLIVTGQRGEPDPRAGGVPSLLVTHARPGQNLRQTVRTVAPVTQRAAMALRILLSETV